MNGPTPRIIKETNNLKTEKIPGIFCEVDPNNFKHFFVKIQGMSFSIQVLRRLVIKVVYLMLSYCFQMTIL